MRLAVRPTPSSSTALRALRSVHASADEKLAAALESDSRASVVLHNLEQRAAQRKQLSSASAAKFQWQQAWRSLLQEESESENDLLEWMRSHSALMVPKWPADSGVNGGGDSDVPLHGDEDAAPSVDAATEDVWSRLPVVSELGEAADWLDSAAFERALLRKRLLHDVKTARGAVEVARGHASEVSTSFDSSSPPPLLLSAPARRAQQLLDQISDWQWALKEELYAREAVAEEDATAGQAAVWASLRSRTGHSVEPTKKKRQPQRPHLSESAPVRSDEAGKDSDATGTSAASAKSSSSSKAVDAGSALSERHDGASDHDDDSAAEAADTDGESESESVVDDLEVRLDAVGGAACPDPALRLEFLQQAHTLRAAAQAALAALSEEYEGRCDALGIPPGRFHRFGIVDGAADVKGADADAGVDIAAGADAPEAAAADDALARSRREKPTRRAAGAVGGNGGPSPGCGGWTRDAHTAYLQVFGRLGAVSAAAVPAAHIALAPGSAPASAAANSAAGGRRSSLRSAGSAIAGAAGASSSGGGSGSSIADRADTVARLVATLSSPLQRMPGVTRESVLLHDAWWGAYRAYCTRAGGRRAQYSRERAALLERAKEAFAQARVSAEDRAARDGARRAHERRQRTTHARLRAAREAAEIEAAVAAEVNRSLAEAEAAVAAATRAAATAAAAAKKAALEAYRRERDAIEAALAANRAAADELAAAEAAAQRVVGAEKVAARRAADEAARASKAAALAAEAESLEKARSAALQRLIASVPYYERVTTIATTSDAARVIAPTVASATAAELSRAYADFLAEAAAAHAAAAGGGGAGGGGSGRTIAAGVAGAGGDGAGDSDGEAGDSGDGDGDGDCDGHDHADAARAGEGDGDTVGPLSAAGTRRHGHGTGTRRLGAGAAAGGARTVYTARSGASSATWAARGNRDIAAAARDAEAAARAAAAAAAGAGGAIAASAAAGGAGGHLTGAAAAERAEEAARRARALASLAHTRAAEQGMFSRHGFEDKRVTSDPRWRVMTALHDAGVSRNAYARQAFASVAATGRGAVTAVRSGASSVGQLFAQPQERE